MCHLFIHDYKSYLLCVICSFMIISLIFRVSFVHSWWYKSYLSCVICSFMTEQSQSVYATQSQYVCMGTNTYYGFIIRSHAHGHLMSLPLCLATTTTTDFLNFQINTQRMWDNCNGGSHVLCCAVPLGSSKRVEELGSRGKIEVTVQRPGEWTLGLPPSEPAAPTSTAWS